MSGVPVVIVPSGGIPITQVESGAPLLVSVQSGGVAVTLTDNAAPFVISGFSPLPDDDELLGGAGSPAA